jgi:hypothetical protein
MFIPVIYDIAILKLASPVERSNGFVCLPTNDLDQFVGADVTASGWGTTSDQVEEVSEVKQVRMG